MAIHLASCLRCHTFSQNVRQTYSLPSQTPQTVAERVAISEGREWERYMCSLHIHKPALIVHGYQSVEPVGCAVWSPHAFLRHYAWPGGNSTTTCPAVLASSGYLPYKEPARPPQVGVNHIPTWAYVTGLPEASAGLRRGRYTHTQSTHHESKSTFKQASERGVPDRARHYRGQTLPRFKCFSSPSPFLPLMTPAPGGRSRRCAWRHAGAWHSGTPAPGRYAAGEAPGYATPPQ